jgi:hypothetical protein
MGAQQREERSVALGEVRAGFAEKEEPNGPPWPGIGPWRLGKTQLKPILESLRPSQIAIYARGMPLSD